MKSAPRYLVERWQSELRELFDGDDRQDVLDWLIANHDRKRVVLAGAGFSKNALNPRSVSIPLWANISEQLAADLRVDPTTFDALTLADFHRRNLGPSAFQARLLSLLDDDALAPGDAHSALWRSQPEAVITTNFLDTLLERNAAAQPVIEDPDLALPTEAGRIQIIYFHGHRANFDSWVAGRSDYDDLQSKRPMLFARTRQLFAQFPLLVVGYSLTDPDFHLVYREMVRAMNQRHPMGLAVFLPHSGANSSQAERAAKKYWEDLGLRIVRFRANSEGQPCAGGTWESVFVRFFNLTKRVERRQELEQHYRTAASDSELAEALRANMEIMRSAFEDPSLDRVWSRSARERGTFWGAALDKALTLDLIKLADTNARDFNLFEFNRHAAADGAAATRKPEPPELDRAAWASAPLSNPHFTTVWEQLSRQRGYDLVWRINYLLQRGVSRELLADWARFAVQRVEILDEPSTETAIIFCTLLLLGGWRDLDLKAVRELAPVRHPPLAQILGGTDADEKLDSPLVVLLRKARSEVERYEYARANASYREAANAAAASAESDAPLLNYFALTGLEDTVKGGFSEPDLQKRSDAAEQRQLAEEHAVVRQWLQRAEEFTSAIQRSRINVLKREVRRGRYEASTFSSSSSAWHLNVMLEDARRRGAPVSVLADLTSPLLGSYDALQDEFRERLRLNLEKPGEWLANGLETGDLFRSKSDGFVPDYLQAGSSERIRGVEAYCELVFEEAGRDSHLCMAGAVDVLQSAAQVIRVRDVSQASELITRTRDSEPDFELGKALSSLARVTRWCDLKEQFLREQLDIDQIASNAHRLPIEHWIICDDFLGDGGGEFLQRLSENADSTTESLVAEALAHGLSVAASDSRLLETCKSFASKLLGAEEPNDEGWATLARFVALSESLRLSVPQAEIALREVVETAPSVRRILASSRFDTELRSLARKSLQNLVDDQLTDLRDHVMAVAFGDDALINWERVQVELSKSWRSLPLLAPVLVQDCWTPGGWLALRELLRTGGHRGKPASWLLGRLGLVTSALNGPGPRESLFDDSTQGLGFMRSSLVDAISAGDAVLANHAVYGLAKLALWRCSDADADAVASGLVAAADDVRINVAHGAAFVAHYLLQQREVREIHSVILVAAQKVADLMTNDPSAIIQRQIQFGVAKGRRDAANWKGDVGGSAIETDAVD